MLEPNAKCAGLQQARAVTQECALMRSVSLMHRSRTPPHTTQMAHACMRRLHHTFQRVDSAVGWWHLFSSLQHASCSI